MKLDEKLVYLRKEKGLTQLELAEAVKVSRQAVSKWESGGSIPSTENLSCLSKLYDVSVDYLLNEREERENGNDNSYKENVRDGHETVCEDTRKVTIRWVAVALVLLILMLSLGLFIFSKSKEDPIWIDEIVGEEVEPNRNFNVEW